MHHLLSKIKKIKWRCIWTGRGTSPFPQVLTINAVTSNFKKSIGKKFSIVVTFYKQGELSFYFPDGEWVDIGKIILNKISKNSGFVRQVNKHIKKHCDLLVKYAKQAGKMKLDYLSNKELYKIYEKYCQIDNKLRDYAWVASIVDFDSNILTNYLYLLLKEKIKDERMIGPLFSYLTKPKGKSFSQKERESQQKIISIIKSKQKYYNLFKKEANIITAELPKYQYLYQNLERHYKNFTWISVVFENEPLSLGDFVAMIKDNLETEPTKTIEDSEPKIKLSKSEKRIFDDAASLLYYKAYRKDKQGQSHYYFRAVLEEISKRLILTLRQTRYLLPQEIRRTLLLNIHVNKNILDERFLSSLAITQNGKTEFIIGKKAAKAIYVIQKRMSDRINTVRAEKIKGQTAYPGIIRGRVITANSRYEIAKIKEGDILVSTQTNPDMAAGLRKCVGLITDHGGITCHAAIVARELKIPCVVGTKNATKILRDGDLVEVDANEGCITIIEMAARL